MHFSIVSNRVHCVILLCRFTDSARRHVPSRYKTVDGAHDARDGERESDNVPGFVPHDAIISEFRYGGVERREVGDVRRDERRVDLRDEARKHLARAELDERRAS